MFETLVFTLLSDALLLRRSLSLFLVIRLFRWFRILTGRMTNNKKMKKPCSELKMLKRIWKTKLDDSKMERSPKTHVRPRRTEIASIFWRRLIILFCLDDEQCRLFFLHVSLWKISEKMIELKRTIRAMINRTP